MVIYLSAIVLSQKGELESCAAPHSDMAVRELYFDPELAGVAGAIDLLRVFAKLLFGVGHWPVHHPFP